MHRNANNTHHCTDAIHHGKQTASDKIQTTANFLEESVLAMRKNAKMRSVSFRERRAGTNELKRKGAMATAMLAMTQLQLRSTEGKLAKKDMELQEQTEEATSTKAELAKTEKSPGKVARSHLYKG